MKFTVRCVPFIAALSFCSSPVPTGSAPHFFGQSIGTPRLGTDMEKSEMVLSNFELWVFLFNFLFPICLNYVLNVLYRFIWTLICFSLILLLHLLLFCICSLWTWCQGEQIMSQVQRQCSQARLWLIAFAKRFTAFRESKESKLKLVNSFLKVETLKTLSCFEALWSFLVYYCPLHFGFSPCGSHSLAV